MVFKKLSEFRKAHPSEYNFLYHKGWLEKFCKDMKWNLYRQKPKGYWTFERCFEIAKNCDSIKDWRELNETSYFYARKNNWLIECTAHMVKNKKMTFEGCFEETLKYKSRTEWIQKNPYSYKIAKKNGWVDTCCTHMISRQKPRGYWTKERCIEESAKCENKNEFYKSPIYNAALRLKCVEDCVINFK
jgi:hypothetical protein